jgi:sulfite reductase alpha subunit-like flavoprotein
LEPWIDNLLQSLLQLCPLSPGVEIISTEDTPSPRVSLSEISGDAFKSCENPLATDNNYHTGTVKCNRRITTDDWNQDVRHFEFEFADNIQ